MMRPRPSESFAWALSPLIAALLMASGATTAQAQAQPAAAERVQITGSNIRRTDTETPSPVVTLTAQDIERSGYSTVADALRNLSANNMGALGQATPGAFGAGGSGVSLRGLTVGATLVLIDGQRMASYPLPDDGQRDFVDISSIPIGAVERIEVLKDGASAIYGSDAIAGVINVILKKSHKGTLLQADVGQAQRSGGRSRQVSGVRGWGDLARDGWTAYVAADLRQRQPILLSDRPFLTTTDWSRFGGISDGPPPDNGELQVAPRTRNGSVVARATVALPNAWTADVSASLLSSQAEQVGLKNYIGGPEGGVLSFVFGPKSPLPKPSALNGTNIIDPATGEPVADYVVGDLGAQRSRTTSQSRRLVATLSGAVGDWDLQASAGLTQVRTTLDMFNYLSLPAFQSALTRGTYRLDGNNAAAVLAQIAPNASSLSTNDLSFVNLRASRELMKLPGGAMSLGTGVEFISRELKENFPETFASGVQSSNIYAFGVGQQRITAAYAEVTAPLTKTFQVDAAARVDHYNTYGTSATPKVGAKWSPTKTTTLRGTYAKGFRAPNAVEAGISGSSAGFLPALYDTALCKLVKPGQPCDLYVGGTQLQLPGQNLKPERSTSYTLGLLLEPTPWMNLSVDYYDVKITDQIVSPGLFGQAQIDRPAAYGTKLYRVSNPTVANAAPTTAEDTILYGTYPFINLGQVRTNGVDVDLRFKLDGGAAGRFTPSLQLSRMFRYTIDREGLRYELAGTHGPSFVSTNTGTPRDRVAASLTWNRGAAEMTATVQHISSFTVTDPSYDVPDCSAALGHIYPNGAPANSQLCRVGSFTTLNLNGRYAVTKNFSLRASVVNALAAKPPIDAFASSSTGGGVAAGGAHYNPSLHQDGAVGRFVSVGASYSF